MNILSKISITAMLFFVAQQGMSQATTLGDTGVSSDYLGWNATVTNLDLNIRTETPNDVKFIVPGSPLHTTLIEAGLEVGYSLNTLGTSEVSIGFMSANDNIGLRTANQVAVLGVPPAFGGIFTTRATAVTSVGVWGECVTVNEPNENIGINAFVCTDEGRSIAVYGEASADLQTTTIFAGLFEGDVYRDAAWIFSDQNLKEDILDFESATDLLVALNPVSYEYRSDEYPQLSLPGGTHYGFISQEVEQIIPELTKVVSTPTNFDYAGNIVNESMDIATLNYTGVIPLIVGSLNERQQVIDQQDATISALEAAIVELEAQLAE